MNEILERMESEIIDEKLQEGMYGINFLIDVSSPLTDKEYTSLFNVVKFCIGDITKASYLNFTIEAFVDKRNVFESKYDVSLDTVRKLLLKIIADEVNENPSKRNDVVKYLIMNMREYKSLIGGE